MVSWDKSAEAASPEPEESRTREAYDWTTEIPGVFARHRGDCPVREGGSCTCGRLGYRASVRSERNVRSLSPVMGTLAAAVAWQREQQLGGPERRNDSVQEPARDTGEGPAVRRGSGAPARRTSGEEPPSDRPVRDDYPASGRDLTARAVPGRDQVGPAVDPRADDPGGERARSHAVDDWLRDFSDRYDLDGTQPRSGESDLHLAPGHERSNVPPPGFRSQLAREPFAQHSDGPLVRSFVRRFLQAAEDGSAGDLTGQPYQGADLRELRDQLRYVDTQLGDLELRRVSRSDVQTLVSRLSHEGMHPRGVELVVESLSALFAHAWSLGLVDDSPVAGLVLPEQVFGGPHTGTQWAARLPAGTFPSSREDMSPYSQGRGYPSSALPRPVTDASLTFPLAGPTSWTGPPSTPAPLATGLVAAPAALGTPATPDASYDATMQERWLWWTARIIVIVFVLIALVLAAESI